MATLQLWDRMLGSPWWNKRVDDNCKQWKRFTREQVEMSMKIGVVIFVPLGLVFFGGGGIYAISLKLEQMAAKQSVIAEQQSSNDRVVAFFTPLVKFAPSDTAFPGQIFDSYCVPQISGSVNHTLDWYYDFKNYSRTGSGKKFTYFATIKAYGTAYISGRYFWFSTVLAKCRMGIWQDPAGRWVQDPNNFGSVEILEEQDMKKQEMWKKDNGSFINEGGVVIIPPLTTGYFAYNKKGYNID